MPGVKGGLGGHSAWLQVGPDRVSAFICRNHKKNINQLTTCLFRDWTRPCWRIVSGRAAQRRSWSCGSTCPSTARRRYSSRRWTTSFSSKPSTRRTSTEGELKYAGVFPIQQIKFPPKTSQTTMPLSALPHRDNATNDNTPTQHSPMRQYPQSSNTPTRQTTQHCVWILGALGNCRWRYCRAEPKWRIKLSLFESEEIRYRLK